MTTTNFRPAVLDDLETIGAMYAMDHLGQGRQNPAVPLNKRYVGGLDAINAEPNQLLLVAEDAGAVVGAFGSTVLLRIVDSGLRASITHIR